MTDLSREQTLEMIFEETLACMCGIATATDIHKMRMAAICLLTQIEWISNYGRRATAEEVNASIVEDLDKVDDRKLKMPTTRVQ